VRSCSWPSAGSADAGPDAGTKRLPVRPHILANCHLARPIQRFRLRKLPRIAEQSVVLPSVWELDGGNCKKSLQMPMNMEDSPISAVSVHPREVDAKFNATRLPSHMEVAALTLPQSSGS
jgi:hypothetical protein